MRPRSTDEDSNRARAGGIHGRRPSGRGNRWETSRFDVRPTAGDAGWAEPPHDVRSTPGAPRAVPPTALEDWNRSDWEGGTPMATDVSFARSRMQQHLAGKGPRNYVRSDERIREDVLEALTYQNVLDATDVEVSVDQGEVTLAGQVPERAHKRAAEDLAWRVRGVKDLHNRITIARAAARPDDGERRPR